MALELTKAPQGNPAARPGRAVPSLPTIRILQVTLVLVLLLQRFGLPVGTDRISVTLPIALLALAALVATGRLVHDRTRLIAYCLSLAACGAATWFAAFSNAGLSLGSFLLLVVLYLPWVFRVPDATTSEHGWTAISSTFLNLMLMAAVVAVLELVSQLLGFWIYQDPLTKYVPDQWLLQGYNTSSPTQYASPIYKSQSFVFLEPSFLSQFLALALIVGILHRASWWKLTILGLAMFCTYSGTGIILLGAGLLLVLMRMPRKLLRPGLVLVGAVGIAVILSSPYAAPLLQRTNETSDSASSLSLRFIQGYQRVADGMADHPIRYLVGGGPGSAERLLENNRHGAGLAVVYTIVPKVYFEYGLIAGSMLLVFLGLAVFRRAAGPVLPGALVVMLGLLSGSLLQPHTLLMAWMLSVVWGRGQDTSAPLTKQRT